MDKTTRPIELIFTVDVEEEGLFSGNYPRIPPGVTNVSSLHRLAFVSAEFGFPLTLLATYPVLRDLRCREILADQRDHHGAEIGLHLHPWNTPPFSPFDGIKLVRSDDIPASLLAAKLETLAAAQTEGVGGIPMSFRMGRFDMGRQLPDILCNSGIRVDSSIVPMKRLSRCMDFYCAPSDPFPLVSTPDGRNRLMEIPVTTLPIFPGSNRAVRHLLSALPEPLGDFLVRAAGCVGVAGIQPVWYSLPMMKFATLVHLSRGGRTLTLSLHSSELMPGGSPRYPSDDAVEGLMKKIRDYLEWLVQKKNVAGVTLTEAARRRTEG